MQSMNIYHYKNAIEVQVNTDPTITNRSRKVYERTIKVYKGVDNVIQFLFKNADQKPVNVTNWVITFNMISDTEDGLIVSKPATVINANAGIVTATLTSMDLLNLRSELYNFAVTVTDPLGSEQVVYSDDNYSVRGEIELLDGPYPKLLPSVDVLLPTISNGVVTSSYVASDVNSWMQSVHHTAQFYFDNFTGNIAVQTTLDSIPPNGNTSANISVSWGNVTVLPYVGQTVSDYCNFDGVFTAVRFKIYTDSGEVTKVLYRG